MYQFSYSEVVDELPKEARARERQAIERSIGMLEDAESKGVDSRAAIDALVFTRRLWSLLIEDLAKPENDLPRQLRADLISIGLWVLQEVENIRVGKSKNFRGILEISKTIAEGLK